MKTTIDIRILADGRVVFGDLPAELAEVAEVLAGSRQAASDSATLADRAGASGVEQAAAAARCSEAGGAPAPE